MLNSHVIPGDSLEFLNSSVTGSPPVRAFKKLAPRWVRKSAEHICAIEQAFAEKTPKLETLA